MSKTHWITIGLMISAAVILIAWDVVVAINNIPGDTISELIQEAANRWLLLPAAIGIVLGHWFLPHKTKTEGNTRWIIPISIALLPPLIADMITFGHTYPYWEYLLPVTLLAYCCVGHLFWPMRVKD